MGNQGSSVMDKKKELQKWRLDYIVNLIEREGLTEVQNDDDDVEADEKYSNIDPKQFTFPFENFILEGGGVKGVAYSGVFKYLEEIGVMQNIKRFAGSSIGSLLCAFLVLGFSAEEIKVLLEQNLESILKDGSYFSSIKNVFQHFGFHPGKGFETWMGKRIEEKTGSADITFEEVRRKYGRELCVVVANLSWMRTEYLHPKTTPDMPIRSAVSMSMSFPGVFTAKFYDLFGRKDVFVDGGLVCNYPIHCFDGWFLSMAKEDNFIERLLETTNRQTSFAGRFKEDKVNFKSLGVVVFSEWENDIYQSVNTRGKPEPARPEKETKYFKKREEEIKHLKRTNEVQRKLVQAVISFHKVLEKHNLNKDFIYRKELQRALHDEMLSKTDAEILFGPHVCLEDVFDLFDHNNDGKIDQWELVNFIGGLGIPVLDWSWKDRRKDITTLTDFVVCLVETMFTSIIVARLQPGDAERTVAIDTGYVKTLDFDATVEDKDFIAHRGYHACRKFLQYFVSANNLQPKSE